MTILTTRELSTAIQVYNKARTALGPRLGGHSITDLLADNTRWPLATCAAAAAAIQARFTYR